jgi:hypothetical protein
MGAKERRVVMGHKSSPLSWGQLSPFRRVFQNEEMGHGLHKKESFIENDPSS